MSKSWDDIVNIVQQRRSYDTALQRQQISIRDRFNAALVIPMTATPEENNLPALAPQVIHDGIENNAMRAGMSNPSVFCPPLDGGKLKGEKSREYATIRRRAIYANWHFSNFSISRARMFRQLCGYGTFAAIVVPDFESKRARIEVRDALSAYPELRSPDDYRPPKNCGFVYGKSADWLMCYYPQEMTDVIGQQTSGMWDMVEWIDEDDVVLGIIGPRDWDRVSQPNSSISSRPTFAGGLELRRWPNRAGMVPVGCPRRVTLDSIAGQMDSVTGVADWLDRLMTLNVIASEKGIWSDMYVLSDENTQAELAGGEWKDGRSGEVNVLTGARTVGQLLNGNNPMSLQIIDRLERTANRSGGNSPQFGGEMGGARTGRAIDTLGSFSIDPRIKEMQEILSVTMAESINPGILEVEKGYWPNKKYVVFSGRPSDLSHVEYTPSKHFESTANSVTYSFPGVDLSEVSVTLLQLVGAKMMSRHSARLSHPMIEDAENDEKIIIEEELDQALRDAIATQVAQGAIPLIDFAAIRKYQREGMTLEEALLKADEDARARQAAPPVAEEAMEPGMEPAMAGAPGMPGLSMPGMGAESQGPPPGMPGPSDDQSNLQAMLGALRQ